MREFRALLAGLALATVGLSTTAFATDWKVENQAYWIKVNEFYSDDQQIHGNGTHGVISETGYQSGADVWYTRPSIEVWDASTGGNKLATVWGVCIDTADFVGNTRHEATLQKGWADIHTGITHRMNGTVTDDQAWARVTYMAANADWGLSDPTGTAASAFQLATWELVGGDGITGANLTTGQFKAGNASGTMLSDVNSYVSLGWERPQDWTGSESWYFHNTQDFLINSPTRHEHPPVPEIPAAVLGPLGLVVFGAVRRRFAR